MIEVLKVPTAIDEDLAEPVREVAPTNADVVD